MKRKLNGVVGAFVAASVMFGSTAASAAAVVPVQQANPWGVLAAMNGGASAATLCSGASNVSGACVLPAAQPTQVPPSEAGPPPPVVAGAPGLGGMDPMLIGLFVVAAALGVYLVAHKSGHGNSPA